MKLNIYTKKRRWKWLLLIIALLIVFASLYYTNRLVKNIAFEERMKVQLWAQAIHKKASLVKYTGVLFEKLKTQEREKVELWAEANKKLVTALPNEDLTFYLKIISGNKTIPVIVTNEKGMITSAINVNFNPDTQKIFTDQLKKEFSIYDPLVIRYYKNYKIYLYYKNSTLFTDLQDVLNDLIRSFISEVVINSASSPVIITDSTKTKMIGFGNLDSLKIKDKTYFEKTLSVMSSQNNPIKIDLANQGICYIFYKDSPLLTRLRYFPYIQFCIIGIFLFISYLLFSTSRKAEQNQVWMGMAKETAHQLGTPLSSLMAWLEIFKSRNIDPEITNEIEKDIRRLETITERFSKIGSPPKLHPENLVKLIYNSIEYLKLRTSKKLTYIITIPETSEIMVPLNVRLFEWVIENLCKNAADAMDGQGIIKIEICEEEKHVVIDVSDSGKGIAKSLYKTIFNPGFTTKQRGWGLGLSLAERIVVNVHGGKIFVKKSTMNKGTTFRIILKK